jgi:hypothetical protein
MMRTMSEIDYTPYGFMTYAESYGRSAFIVAQAMEAGARMPFAVPIGTLALHCVELSLKGVLVKGGMTPDEVRDRPQHQETVRGNATRLVRHRREGYRILQ